MPILPSPGPRWLSLAMDLVRSVLSLDLTGYVRSANCRVVENICSVLATKNMVLENLCCLSDSDCS